MPLGFLIIRIHVRRELSPARAIIPSGNPKSDHDGHEGSLLCASKGTMNVPWSIIQPSNKNYNLKALNHPITLIHLESAFGSSQHNADISTD